VQLDGGGCDRVGVHHQHRRHERDRIFVREPPEPLVERFGRGGPLDGYRIVCHWRD